MHTWRKASSSYRFSLTKQSPKKSEDLQKLKDILKNLEQKQGVVFKDGFNSIDLIESKLRELTDSKSN
jgi:hypothetical protein